MALWIGEVKLLQRRLALGRVILLLRKMQRKLKSSKQKKSKTNEKGRGLVLMDVGAHFVSSLGEFAKKGK